MATDTLKSQSITNLDASPVSANTAGQGATGRLRVVNDHAAATAAAAVGSTYRLCRIPTNAVVKRVLLTNAAQGATGAVDIDIAFSDSTTDGTPAALQGTIPQVSSADNKLFGAAVAVTSAQANKDVTFTGSFTTTHQNMELWAVLNALGSLGWTSDPGGFFDILVKATAIMANGGDVSVEVDFVA
jgi:hypothetical protein